MKLFFDGNIDRPEIELSDSPDGLRNLGQLVLNLDKEIQLSAEQVCDDVYPYNLKGLVLKINSDRQGDDLLHISVAENNLVFEGTPIALEGLGQSLINCFDENTPDRYHIHLDYFPGSPLVAPTNCNLIIVCQR